MPKIHVNILTLSEEGVKELENAEKLGYEADLKDYEVFQQGCIESSDITYHHDIARGGSIVCLRNGDNLTIKESYLDIWHKEKGE